jgi:thioredoxin reductase (NADPH)
MSRYLIRRIEESPSITLRPYTEVEAIEGNGRPEKIRWRDSKTSGVEVRDIRHLSCGARFRKCHPKC